MALPTIRSFWKCAATGAIAVAIGVGIFGLGFLDPVDSPLFVVGAVMCAVGLLVLAIGAIGLLVRGIGVLNRAIRAS